MAEEVVVEAEVAIVVEQIPGIDDICPDGAADDCVAEVGDRADVAGGEGADDTDSAGAVDEATVEADCDERPWSLGCDGPIPEEGDQEPYFERYIDDADVEGDDGDDGAIVDGPTGVQVPQEIQDLLLAPIDDE